MLDMIEKLINEHGSSTILKERLELFNDKYEALEAKLQNSEREVSLLKQENELLKHKVAELENDLNAHSKKEQPIPEEQISILKLLFGSHDSVEERAIARHLNIDLGITKYHLNELETKYLIDASFTMGNAFTGESGTVDYYITDAGRKYVVEVLGT
ncbi:hypothetical protein R6I31_003279 [Vibrio cholerae]|uniref:hypothetical protein n=1 Tax=Vibrio cholerae TaxID=666 RepID=UPI000663A994|nr:hypothetical protein [Vibrio cholerae]EIC9802241.1 hypothetical protein [Vibrio cholerae]EIJ0935766.1 hypothetical protein [Vibrio cholerae]ELS9246539.1 hypothetical protein [Vibrio cholerae]MEB3763900.1 hypothetical protein [Vibrio cholerae]NOF44420.1 hypothetical protein [Vibrio cholerae]